MSTKSRLLLSFPHRNITKWVSETAKTDSSEGRRQILEHITHRTQINKNWKLESNEIKSNTETRNVDSGSRRWKSIFVLSSEKLMNEGEETNIKIMHESRKRRAYYFDTPSGPMFDVVTSHDLVLRSQRTFNAWGAFASFGITRLNDKLALSRSETERREIRRAERT